MNAVEEMLSRIPDKKTRERAQIAANVTTERLPTPSPSLNRALKGGVALGRFHLIYGNKSSGKSSMCLELVAEAQKRGKSCVWVDAEKTFDSEWAEVLGVDVDNLIVVQRSDMLSIANDILKYQQAGADLIVLDSITSITPMSYFEKDGEELKGMEATRKMSALALELSNALGLWNEENENTTLIMISQIRMTITQTYAKGDSTGGKAPRFYSTSILKLTSSESQRQAIMGNIQHGDYVIEEPIGRRVEWVIEANKTGKPFMTGEWDFYFDGPDIGIDRVADLIDLATTFHIIDKRGAWYYVGDEKYQGKDKVTHHFREDLDAFDWLVKEIDAIT